MIYLYCKVSKLEYKKSIWYVGFECFFECEENTTDKAQYWLNYYKRLGYKACCLHEGGKHQVYVSKVKSK